ncbi:MAG: hypothetical protein LIO90_11785 [Bacteroidales bacterium]|nr:hypothetical protein [Bacteroidales bacterium]
MAKKSLKDYEEQVRDILLDASKYHSSYEPLIRSLASALLQLDSANKTVSKLKSTTITKKTRYGEELVAHPVFALINDTTKTIDKLCRTLGITSLWGQTVGHEEYNKGMRKKK